MLCNIRPVFNSKKGRFVIFSKKNIMLLGLICSGTQIVDAINLQGVVVGAMALATQIDARKYHVRNASPDKTMVLVYKCSKRKHSKTLFPNDQITISKCDRIETMTARVQSGEYPFNYDAFDYYDGSPTYNTLYTYRTFKIDSGICKKHHLCDHWNYDKTSIFSRDRKPKQPQLEYSNITSTEEFADHNTTGRALMEEIKVASYLRGTIKK
jgi:hypothetical protein